jgi:uncharacterized protein (DUF2141 family)
MKYFSIIVMASIFFSTSIYGQTGSLNITVSDLRNEKGVVRVALFQNEDGFPNDHKKALQSKTLDINGTQLEFKIDDLPYGEYALAILHDENGNEKMDFNFLRMPKEGYGVSNNVTRSLGPPKFNDAKFTLSSENMPVEITLNY